MRLVRRALAWLLACALMLGTSGCLAPRSPSNPATQRRPTTASGTPTAGYTSPGSMSNATGVPLATLAQAAYGTQAPTPAPISPCGPSEEFAHSAVYLGSFHFEPIATVGRTGIISSTRILIRSAPVPGSTSLQLAFWFQGDGGAGAPYINQLRWIANADCLMSGSGAGIARIVPALQPDDFLVPPLSFGESQRAALEPADPYDFRLFVKDAAGRVPDDARPAEYGFVTGGAVALTQYGAGLEAWHASGTFSLTLSLRSGQFIPPIEGRFDVLSP